MHTQYYTSLGDFVLVLHRIYRIQKLRNPHEHSYIHVQTPTNYDP